MNKKEIFINEQPAEVKIIQASCICGNLLEEMGIKDKEDLQPVYKYKCTKCKADYESTDYFPRIEYDVKFSPTEGQRYNKHGYKIGDGSILAKFDNLVDGFLDYLKVPVSEIEKRSDALKEKSIRNPMEVTITKIPNNILRVQIRNVEVDGSNMSVPNGTFYSIGGDRHSISFDIDLNKIDDGPNSSSIKIESTSSGLFSEIGGRKFRGKPLSDFEYEIKLGDRWAPIKFENIIGHMNIPKWIEEGEMRIKGEKDPETINKGSYQASVDYWRDREKKVRKELEADVTDLRAELVALKKKYLPPCPPEYRDVNGNCDYGMVKNDGQKINTWAMMSDIDKNLKDSGYIEFRVPAGAIIRTDVDGKIMYRLKEEKEPTPFTDYLEKRFHENNEKTFWEAMMAGSPPKSKRELTDSQCREIARLAWCKPYISDSEIKVKKEAELIFINSRNLYCLINLKVLKVYKTCMHYHIHHGNKAYNLDKIADKFKEWGIDPLKEKTIDDLTKDQLFTILEAICPEFPTRYRDAITWLADGQGIGVWLHNKVHTLHIRNNLVVQVTDPNMPQKPGWGHRVHRMLNEWGIKPVTE